MFVKLKPTLIGFIIVCVCYVCVFIINTKCLTNEKQFLLLFFSSFFFFWFLLKQRKDELKMLYIVVVVVANIMAMFVFMCVCVCVFTAIHTYTIRSYIKHTYIYVSTQKSLRFVCLFVVCCGWLLLLFGILV